MIKAFLRIIFFPFTALWKLVSGIVDITSLLLNIIIVSFFLFLIWFGYNFNIHFTALEEEMPNRIELVIKSFVKTFQESKNFFEVVAEIYHYIIETGTSLYELGKENLFGDGNP